jgi:hypothetical protein
MDPNNQPPNTPEVSPAETQFANVGPQMNPKSPAGNHKRLFVVLVIILLLAAGSVYAYFAGALGFTSKPPYTADSLVSGLIAKAYTIDSSSYEFQASLAVGQRDKDAVPFTIKNSNEAELKQKYSRDAKRARDAENIISTLNSHYGDKYSYLKPKKTTPYPLSLDVLKKDLQKSSYYNAIAVTDPGTKTTYDYHATENDTNFSLKVQFDTLAAVHAIKNAYGYVSTSTIVSGQTVTFTKNSPQYVYLPTEPPKPFLEQLAEYMRSLPPEVSVRGSAGASATWKRDGLPDWLFNIDASGTLGDLTYAVNAEALKKDTDYYFRINKIPSLFLGSFASLKGQWIKVSTKTATTTATNNGMYNEFSYLKNDLPRVEKAYKDARVEMAGTLKKIAEIADSEKVLEITNNPHKEKVNGRDLYRYDLVPKETAIVSFYKKIMAENQTRKGTLLGSLPLHDEGLLEYLESAEFKETFDYYKKNTATSLWVDAAGYPAILKYTIRVVPPDTATQLAGKQVNIILSFTLKDINQTFNITAPSGAKSIEAVIEEMNKNMYGSNESAASKASAASTKASLSSVRTLAEIRWDKDGGGYGVNAFPIGPCKKIAGTLFADEEIYKSIQSAAKGNASIATCASSLKDKKVGSYAVSIPLPGSSGYSWCIDSSGRSVEIEDKITSDSCEL